MRIATLPKNDANDNTTEIGEEKSSIRARTPICVVLLRVQKFAHLVRLVQRQHPIMLFIFIMHNDGISGQTPEASAHFGLESDENNYKYACSIVL